MGTWGPGTFEDDIACDWVEDLFESDPIAFFVQCLDLEGESYLEFLACVGVVCTAEVISALLCGARRGLPEAIRQWVASNDTLNVLPLVPSAIEGLRRVAGDESEMQQRFEDNQEMYEPWLELVDDLIQRLQVHAA